MAPRASPVRKRRAANDAAVRGCERPCETLWRNAGEAVREACHNARGHNAGGYPAPPCLLRSAHSLDRTSVPLIVASSPLYFVNSVPAFRFPFRACLVPLVSVMYLSLGHLSITFFFFSVS